MCVLLENVLRGIAIDERALMMWRKHSDGVIPNVLIDNANILLCEGFANAVLRLRRRFMRTCYVPRDVPECATNASSKLIDSVLVLNSRFTYVFTVTFEYHLNRIVTSKAL